ncbi:type 1 fimbrial major subunit FimA [Raoultella planticola]|uniref:type 1 fimbrial major subunit FimA n=1 Tax=Raoultella planticola TaxID=575 RepID=UPI000517189C|nr:type 1 fimbrial major subunit FimA [Raoultella planticola]
MKLNKFAVIFGAVMAMSAGMANAADDAADPAPAGAVTTVTGGTVHFRGSLVDAACAVSADSADQTVTLGQYTLHHFKNVGDSSSAIPFKIKLEDCDTTIASTAAVAFSGQRDATQTNLLAIDSSENGNTATASGVGIQILDEASQKVNPDGSTFSTAHTLVDGENVLNFSAQYVSTVAAPTAGQANADAVFIMQYQ